MANLDNMKFFLLMSALFSFQILSAQGMDSTSVVVHKDPRMEILSKKQASVNAAVKKASARSMKGYRLLVVNTTKRDEAMDAKTKVYTYFPELKSYMVYQTPYFKLKAGNFKTREEAEKYRKSFLTVFPKGVFILNDTIELKLEKDSESSEQ
jgi:hypothetical protein